MIYYECIQGKTSRRYRLIGLTDWNKNFQLPTPNDLRPIITREEDFRRLDIEELNLFGVAYIDCDEEGPRERIYKKKGKTRMLRTHVVVGVKSAVGDENWVDIGLLKQ
ncbi:MAG: hypothetical protein JWL86_7028 [Rhizobium sp.]|nr:hypothetical protein [Rhizobium sp.]